MAYSNLHLKCLTILGQLSNVHSIDLRSGLGCLKGRTESYFSQLLTLQIQHLQQRLHTLQVY